MADKFRRKHRSGGDVWIQAAYNPLLDANGNALKVVKFATDVTAIEEERRSDDELRAAKMAEQERVVAALCGGLKQLSQGNVNEAMSSLHNTLRTVLDNALAVRTGSTRTGSSSRLAPRTKSCELTSTIDRDVLVPSKRALRDLVYPGRHKSPFL